MANLQRGSIGPQVKDLQRRLNARLLPSPGLQDDGKFGALTDAAVRRFQRANRLSVDGIVGPKTKAALNQAGATPTPSPTPSSAPIPTPIPTPTAGGFKVSLPHVASFEGQVLGPPPYQGECAAGVQVIFSRAGIILGLTRTWRPGVRVRGNNVPAGTAIASFQNNRYWKHAAILIRETSVGLDVWDQWAGQPWHRRTLRFNDSDTANGSNNGNLFYVITR